MSPIIRWAALTAAVVLAAGCTGRPSSTGPSHAEREDPNAAPADLVQMISCFRAHGLPDFPDPAYDPSDGRWHLANVRPQLTAEVRRACASVMPHTTPASPIPSARLADLLGFAKCVRSHGVADWPDPAVDGVFHTAIDPKGDATIRAATNACERYLASSGGQLQIAAPDA